MNLLVLTGSDGSFNTLRPEAEIFIGLHKAGHRVTVMTGRDSVYWDRWEKAGVSCIDFEPQSRINPGEIRTLRQYLKNHPVDAVYLFNNKAISCCAFAAVGLPVVLVAYRGQTGNIFWYDPSCYLTLLHPRLNAISCVSNAVRDDLRKQMRKPQNAVTLYKGHDPAWYQATPSSLEDLSLPEDVFLVGCVANNRPRKGIPVLIEALEALPASSRIHVLLIGNGLDADTMSPLLESSPARDRVHALGFRDDAPALVAACQASVLPALKREGLPKTVIESMAYGVPAVVTDTGGNAELVRDGEEGYVVPPGDAAALCQRLQDFEADPTAAEVMGHKAKKRIAEDFHIRDTIAQTEALFERLIRDIR